MMIEMQNVRQIPGDGFRRWFTDDYFDLYIWFQDHHMKHLQGFQLCYNKIKNEHALTWTEKEGYKHETVDDGESHASSNKTPILLADGKFDYNAIADRFHENSTNIDKKLADFVYKKILDYPF